MAATPNADHVVYVSIGSNIARERSVTGCLTALVRAFGAVDASSVYESAAVGHEGDPYYNLAARFFTTASPGRVNEILRGIEDAHGRERGPEKFVDRTLDIDILLYDDLAGEVEGLRLPRDEIFEYGHVTAPLAEIAGAVMVPGSGRTVAEIWEELRRGGALRRVPFRWEGIPLPGRLGE